MSLPDGELDLRDCECELQIASGSARSCASAGQKNAHSEVFLPHRQAGQPAIFFADGQAGQPALRLAGLPGLSAKKTLKAGRLTGL